MNLKLCPGLDNYVQPKPEEIICSFCGANCEIWTDEKEIACPSCKNKIKNKTQGCLDWCKHAAKCALYVKVPRAISETVGARDYLPGRDKSK